MDNFNNEEQIKKKILQVLAAHESELELAAEILAPDFDYEAELAAEAEAKAAEVVEAAEDAEAEVETEVEEELPPLPAALVSPSVYPKKPYEAKTAFGKFWTRDKHRATLGATLLLLVGVLVWQLAAYLIPTTVTLTYKSFDGNKTKEVETRATTVEGALADSGFKISDGDLVIPCREKELKKGMEITVRHSKAVTANIAGTKTKITIFPGTVKENLKYNGISYDKNDIVKPGRNAKVGANTNIVVKEVHYKTVTKKEKRKARNTVVLDPSLTSGQMTTVKGHDGVGYFVYRHKYVNGKETEVKKSLKKWVKKPVDNSLRLGTSATGDSGEYEVAWEFTAETTAYWMGDNAIGAAGGRCVYGTCAVDPSYIPYGTKMWVEGYGVAVANDCGGAVKNNILDLWMNSYEQSCQWGRRWVKAYVLK